MTPAQLRATLAALNLKQTHAAALLGVNPSTMRRWIQGVREVHPCAARLLWLMEHANTGYGVYELVISYPMMPIGHFKKNSRPAEIILDD